MAIVYLFYKLLLNKCNRICKIFHQGPTCGENIDDCVGNRCENGDCVDGVANYTCRLVGYPSHKQGCKILSDQIGCTVGFVKRFLQVALV